MTYPYYYPQNNNSGFIWVQGEAGAKSYLVAPGSTVQLWDSDENVIYIKSADASGMPSMKVLDYTIRSEAPKKAQNALYGNNTDIPTRQDLNAMQGQIDALKEQIERIASYESALSANATATGKQSTAEVSAVPAAVSG